MMTLFQTAAPKFKRYWMMVITFCLSQNTWNVLSSHRGEGLRLQIMQTVNLKQITLFFLTLGVNGTYLKRLLPDVTMVINHHSTYLCAVVGLLTDNHPEINPRFRCCSIHQIREHLSFLVYVHVFVSFLFNFPLQLLLFPLLFFFLSCSQFYTCFKWLTSLDVKNSLHKADTQFEIIKTNKELFIYWYWHS